MRCNNKRKKVYLQLFFLATAFLWWSCGAHYFITKKDFDQTQISAVQNDDSVVTKMVLPYHDSIQGQMAEIVAYSRITLKKEQPEGTLGNFVCDILMQHYASLHPDLCVVNNGGLRIGQIAKGAITKGKIFELMPFDNSMLLLYVPGKQLKQLFEKIAQKNGCPVSDGVSLQIEKGKLFSAYLQGNEISEAKTYKLIVSDYLANGGDDCTMLKGLPREDLKELFRDALISQLLISKSKNEKIAASVSGRIVEVKQ